MLFDIFGPFEISLTNNTITKEDITEFIENVEAENNGLTKAYGCYLFAIRASRGYTPWYVGKTEKNTFAKEVFTVHKLSIYKDYIHRKGTPVFFFIPKLTPAGYFEGRSRGGKEIDFLETLLIGRVMKKNPDVANIRKTKVFKEMMVPGIINSSKGKKSNSVNLFLKAIGGE